MNKQQAEQILMKLINDLSLKRQEYLILEQAILTLKNSELSAMRQQPPQEIKGN